MHYYLVDFVSKTKICGQGKLVKMRCEALAGAVLTLNWSIATSQSCIGHNDDIISYIYPCLYIRLLGLFSSLNLESTIIQKKVSLTPFLFDSSSIARSVVKRESEWARTKSHCIYERSSLLTLFPPLNGDGSRNFPR